MFILLWLKADEPENNNLLSVVSEKLLYKGQRKIVIFLRLFRELNLEQWNEDALNSEINYYFKLWNITLSEKKIEDSGIFRMNKYIINDILMAIHKWFSKML